MGIWDDWGTFGESPTALSPFAAQGSPVGSLLSGVSPVLGALGGGGLPGFSSSSSASSAADSRAAIGSSFGVSFGSGDVSGLDSRPDVSGGSVASASAPGVTPGLTGLPALDSGFGTVGWLAVAGGAALLLIVLARK